MALDDFADSWKKYPHIVKSWLGDWTELMAFMDYGPEMRRLMYTTNALENVNRQIRKSTKSKGSWTSAKALTTQIYLILQATSPAWVGMELERTVRITRGSDTSTNGIRTAASGNARGNSVRL